MITALKADPKVNSTGDLNLIGPNLSGAAWSPEMVWDTGFIPSYAPNLFALAVEQYVPTCIVTRASAPPYTVFFSI